MRELFFSILIPTYKGADIITPTLKSILNQSFKNYEIIISEDASGDDIERVINNFNDSRIRFFRNVKNLGYSKNLELLRQRATGDVIFLMGQDDVLSLNALQQTHDVFLADPDIGAVTRPYFWFHDEITKPVRVKKGISSSSNTTLSMKSDRKDIVTMFSSLDQLSGLAYRREFMDVPFHEDIFPCHVYPFASIFKNHKIVFLKDYTVAVRIGTSQTRFVSWIYDKSPLLSWVQLFENVFSENAFEDFKQFMIQEFVAKNYVGLIQIKNYSRYSYKYTLREIYYLIKYRKKNLISPVFWLVSIFVLIIPSALLIRFVVLFKEKIYSQLLKDIKFIYNID